MTTRLEAGVIASSLPTSAPRGTRVPLHARLFLPRWARPRFAVGLPTSGRARGREGVHGVLERTFPCVGCPASGGWVRQRRSAHRRPRSLRDDRRRTGIQVVRRRDQPSKVSREGSSQHGRLVNENGERDERHPSDDAHAGRIIQWPLHLLPQNDGDILSELTRDLDNDAFRLRSLGREELDASALEVAWAHWAGLGANSRLSVRAAMLTSRLIPIETREREFTEYVAALLLNRIAFRAKPAPLNSYRRASILTYATTLGARTYFPPRYADA